MSNVAILNKTMCINLSVTEWSGRRALQQEEMTGSSSTRPPTSLASLGSIKLCDPSLLRPFGNAKQQAERELQKVSVRFLGGYATDEANINGIVKQLDVAKQAYEALTKSFVDQLPLHVSAWAKENDVWRNLIERNPPDATKVARRYSFNYQIFRVAVASQADVSSSINAGLNEAVGGLAGQLFREVAVDAQEVYKRSFEGRDVVGQKALRPIRRMQVKLQALSYLEGAIVPLIDRIDQVLTNMPKTGDIDGIGLSALVGLIKLLSSPAEMRAHGTGIFHPDTLPVVDENLDDELDVVDTPSAYVLPTPNQPAEKAARWF